MIFRHLTFGLLFLVSACAQSQRPSGRFDAATNQSTFRTPKVLVGNLDMSTGLASGQRVMAQAFAECEGRGCTPSEVELAFINDSGDDLNLDHRRVRLDFDGRTLEWEDESRIDEAANYRVPRGEFIRLTLLLADFVRLAIAREVKVHFGLTGTAILNFSQDRRQPFRELLDALDEDAEG